MTYVGFSLGAIQTGLMSASRVLRGIRIYPCFSDTLKDLSMDGENVDKLCYSANRGALSGTEQMKINQHLELSSMAMGIEMAMVRKGATRLTTRAVDNTGRVYTEFWEYGIP